MQAAEDILQLRNIRKTYPGVVALSGISLNIRRGEVHALVGENGAGKSTLIKTCSGAIEPDSGEIVIEGKSFTALSPRTSEDNGISVIYQEFNLVNELSVAENIFLGKALRRGIMIDRKAMAARTAEIFSQFDIDIDPHTLVGSLSVGYQQIVEIAKAMSRNSRILIMDEPSAPLTSAEIGQMYTMVESLKAAGVTIIYISHRLDEIFHLSDRITVLRDGTMVKTLNTADTNPDELITLMVGREMKEVFPPRKACIQDNVLLEVNNLCGNGVTDMSFTVRKGEILGFAGLVGAGRTETAELLFGVKPRNSGEIRLHGKAVQSGSPREAIACGIALVPEDRKRQGVLLDTSIRENISVSVLHRISRCSVINKATELLLGNKYKDELRIKTPSLEQLAKNLSGGNQQKVVLAKWLSSEPELLIFDEPTRGIDVGAKYEIYKLINMLAESGKGILLISSEMEELIGMSDRILVLTEGRMVSSLEKAEFSQEGIMRHAAKSRKEGTA